MILLCLYICMFYRICRHFAINKEFSFGIRFVKAYFFCTIWNAIFDTIYTFQCLLSAVGATCKYSPKNVPQCHPAKWDMRTIFTNAAAPCFLAPLNTATIASCSSRMNVEIIFDMGSPSANHGKWHKGCRRKSISRGSPARPKSPRDDFHFSINIMLRVSFLLAVPVLVVIVDFFFLDRLGKTAAVVFVLFS